jgi:hypothetical protein
MSAAPPVKTLAYKVIGAHPGLSGKAKSIGVLLIDHFNLDTQRCDPGLKSLSKRANCTTKTTRRVLRSLKKWKLFGWQPQAGINRTNAYYPNLEHFKSLAKALETGEPNWWKHEGDIFVPESRTILSKSPDKFARQTLEGNLEDKTLEEGCPMKRGEYGSDVLDLARRRILDDAHVRCNGDSGRLKRLLDRTLRDWREAAAAELRCPGDGIRVLEERQARR